MNYNKIENVSTLREQDGVKLKEELATRLRSLFALKLKYSIGETVKPHLFKLIKRDIAKIKTVISENAKRDGVANV